MKKRVNYVTSSSFKKQENRIFTAECILPTGERIQDVFDFHICELKIQEVLEVDLEKIVKAEVINAYSQIKVPCIVEHAGIIFQDLLSSSYPGGLTKPMFNALGEKFIKETNSCGRQVIARAVVGYCNGWDVKLFSGETSGKIATEPRGEQQFYWDTIFIPDQSVPELQGKTYAEIVSDKNYGLRYKVCTLSQSSKALIDFLSYYKDEKKFLF